MKKLLLLTCLMLVGCTNAKGMLKDRQKLVIYDNAQLISSYICDNYNYTEVKYRITTTKATVDYTYGTNSYHDEIHGTKLTYSIFAFK